MSSFKIAASTAGGLLRWQGKSERRVARFYVIKQPYYSVHIYVCIPEIYVITRFILI